MVNNFKKGELITCKNNIGYTKDLIEGKRYKVVAKTYREYNAEMINIIGENKVLIGIFASRFTTLKIERRNKLKKLDEIWKDVNH